MYPPGGDSEGPVSSDSSVAFFRGRDALVLKVHGRRFSHEGLMTCSHEGKVRKSLHTSHLSNSFSLKYSTHQGTVLGTGMSETPHYSALRSASVITFMETSWGCLVFNQDPLCFHCHRDLSRRQIPQAWPTAFENTAMDGLQSSPKFSFTLAQWAPGSIWALWSSPVPLQTTAPLPAIRFPRWRRTEKGRRGEREGKGILYASSLFSIVHVNFHIVERFTCGIPKYKTFRCSFFPWECWKTCTITIIYIHMLKIIPTL